MDDPFPDGMLDEIIAVLAKDGAVPPGQDVYPHIFETERFFPLQRMRETAKMLATARAIAPRVVMEIGADKGGGIYHWVKGLEPEMCLASEIRGLPYAQVFSQTFPDTRFGWFEGSSYAPETLTQVETALDGRYIDVLFLDGDKSQFYTDYVAYIELVRVGGIVCMHDITDPAPGDAFYRASQHHRVRHASRILDTSESFEAAQRATAGFPALTPYERWLRHWEGRSCGVGVLAV